jgi:hypothetical protein
MTPLSPVTPVGGAAGMHETVPTSPGGAGTIDTATAPGCGAGTTDTSATTNCGPGTTDTASAQPATGARAIWHRPRAGTTDTMVPAPSPAPVRTRPAARSPAYVQPSVHR